KPRQDVGSASPQTPNRMRFEGRTTGQDGRAGGGLNDEASTGCRLGLTPRRRTAWFLKGERPQDGCAPVVPAYNANGK
ncbi:hypothetical protein, partial [Pseudomonas aeruginosa]|uniref:hypothetical protein n=4 Tax=Pseudomonas aeruginosa TaxID=287 RepID=UPI001E39CFD1